MLYFSEKRREGEWISFSPWSLNGAGGGEGGTTVHVNLCHSVNVSASPPHHPFTIYSLWGLPGLGAFVFYCRSRSTKKIIHVKNVFA